MIKSQSCINSLILEGKFMGDSVKVGNALNFTLETWRQVKTDNGLEEEHSYIPVRAYGQLAEVIEREVAATKKNMDTYFRVVGRLKSEEFKFDGKTFSNVVLLCEHVEVKRIPRKVEPEILY